MTTEGTNAVLYSNRQKQVMRLGWQNLVVNYYRYVFCMHLDLDPLGGQQIRSVKSMSTFSTLLSPHGSIVISICQYVGKGS